MKNKRNVAVTGYYGTGSSAVTDLLREYTTASVVPYEDKNFEHVVFYVSGGLFDLCTLLTHGNSPFTSDMVINNFIDAMKRLDRYDFVWFGSYQKQFGDKFKNLYTELIRSISTPNKGQNSNHIISERFSVFKALLQIATHLVYKRNFIQYGKKYVYDGKDVYFSMPTEEEVYAAARKFTRGYFNLFEIEGKDIKVFDHLIWANQVDEYMSCFDNDFKVIVVERDPRDVYLLNKYIWFKPPVGHGTPHFPINPEAFINEWLKTVVGEYTNPNLKRVHFESLIYDYEETVKEIEVFLGLSPSDHSKKGIYLDTSKSIENTQVFNGNYKWMNEVKPIEERLGNFLFKYPYKRIPNTGKMFDDPRTIASSKK